MIVSAPLLPCLLPSFSLYACVLQWTACGASGAAGRAAPGHVAVENRRGSVPASGRSLVETNVLATARSAKSATDMRVAVSCQDSRTTEYSQIAKHTQIAENSQTAKYTLIAKHSRIAKYS